MEDSNEVHSEENRVSFEKNPKRILKTPAQINALENFYNEQTYPTEEMKSELAEQIGLTEKQISSWFCHRRLKDKKVTKDEVNANGRHDRSSGIIQDRGSGLRQDSCGSTKQGDYKKVDPKEVESQRLYDRNFPAAEPTYDRTSRYTGILNPMDDTSSESSSSLQEKMYSQDDDPYEMKSSGYVTQNGANRLTIPKGASNMGYKPSGYLKVKGEIEYDAITAVKRQLGKHYREDGPPLGVEFEALPPGAFSSASRDPVSGAFFVGDLARNRSPDVSGARKLSSTSNRYDVYNNSKMSSQDSYMDGANYNLQMAFDYHDKKSHLPLKRKPSYGHSNSSSGGKAAMDKYDDPALNTSIQISKRNYKMGSKHYNIEGIRPETVSNHHHRPDAVVYSEQREPWLQECSNGSSKTVQRNIPKPNVILGSGNTHDTEERALSTRTAKEEHPFVEMKGIKEYRDPVRARPHAANEIKVPKQLRPEFSEQEYLTKTSYPNTSRKINSKIGSTMERPSSFSDDETAETSSSDRGTYSR
ncbi:uncharacterized protein LOC126688102 [Mercurialis annua]|uniref:uncharacterized protein LOC126688102 n=1 Tax=Mercurialis annua TaxID=3986 RepID=UPI00215FBCD6|nr:uncharacterized protein LOC126688102 [Mercurialis annua]